MSKDNIALLLRNYLVAHQEVCVPGLGRFFAIAGTAEFFEHKYNLAPPKVVYQFQDTNSSDIGFVEYVAHNFDTSFGKADKKVRKFTQELLNRLLNYQSANIPYVGELSIDEHNEITYAPDNNLIELETAYLPTLSLSPIDRSLEHKTGVIRESLDSNKKELGDFRSNKSEIDTQAVSGNRLLDIGLSALLIFLLIIGMKSCFSLYSDNQLRNRGFDANTTVQASTLEDNEQESQLSESDQQELNEQSLSDPLPTDAKDDGVIVDDEVNDHLSDHGTDSNMAIDSQSTGTSNNNDSVTDVNSLNEEETPSLDDRTSINTKEASGVNNEGLPTYSIPSSGNCKIILASLSSISNVNNLKIKISKKGYQPYEESHNGLTRVGIIFNCENVDLESYINEIRGEFNTAAWYLDPSIAVF